MAQDKPEVLILDREEVLALQEYFYKYAGYISYEHNPEVHKVIKKIDGFVGRVK